MLTSKKGISSLQIQRVMGFGSYETALNMTHKIRTALVDPEHKLGGIVEVDETFIGGKDGNKHVSERGKPALANKTPIIGAIQRKGNVIARVFEPYQSGRCSKLSCGELVSHKVSLLATDEKHNLSRADRISAHVHC